MKHSLQHEMQKVTFLTSATQILNRFLYVTPSHFILT